MRTLIKSGFILFAMFSVGINTPPQELTGIQELGKPTAKISVSPEEPTTKDMITFAVEAQDNSGTGLKRIVILVNDREVKVCLMSPCAYSGGPYPEGPLKFEAKVFDHTAGEPWTGLRVITVKDPSRAAGTLKKKVDLFLLADKADTRWANGYMDLAFPGPEGDSQGFAGYRYDALLEDGRVYSRVLVTRPESRDGFGLIVGIFKIEKLPEKAAFKSKVGFFKEAEQTEGAEFKVFVNQDPSFHTAKRCYLDGRLDDLVLDLGKYAGRDVEIVLQVHALNAAAQNLTVWVDPRIE